jgi:hypothetical protein
LSQIFIEYGQDIGNNEFLVGLIHNRPFDKVDGMNMTTQQLLAIGELVDHIPSVEIKEGYGSRLIFNKTTKQFRHEYLKIDIPQTTEQKVKFLEKKNEELKQQQALMQQALDELLLGEM